MINETCSCGATFHTDEKFTLFAERMAAAFRADHRHEEPAAIDAAPQDGAEVLPHVESQDLGPVDLREFLGLPPVQGTMVGGFIGRRSLRGSRFVPNLAAAPQDGA